LLTRAGKDYIPILTTQSAQGGKMQPEQSLDADALAQEVVNAWGMNVTAGNAERLSAGFKALFEKACACRDAKKIADNRRTYNALTTQEAANEQAARKEFLDAHCSFYEA
jgi:hypothetical protein